jgi:hypothetical protein
LTNITSEAELETLRLHVYEAGAPSPVSHSEVPPKTILRELLVVEETETLYRVGTEEIIDLDIEIVALFTGGPVHVIKHHCNELKITVSYTGNTVELKFHPAAHVKKVRAEAVAALGITPAHAADLELRIPGTEDDLDPAKPIGAYVPKGACELALDLVHIVRPQG